MVESAHIILYVEDQEASRAFYTEVLAREPGLHTPGMTMFDIGAGCTLGLMPVAGIRRLLGARLPDPARAHGVPRAELYLYVDDPGAYHQRALRQGARELRALERHGWGDLVAYSLDPDGHVLAFATRSDVPPREALTP